MNFEFLDRYLLEERPPKAQVVKELLKSRPQAPGATAFYEGMHILGSRTPDLTLIALRLVLAGKAADDESVKRLRGIVERARAKDSEAQDAEREYREMLQ